MRWRRPRRASSSSSAATSCPRKRRTGTRKRCGSTCATVSASDGSTGAGANSSRTRTTASAATRSSGAACCIACGARTFRRSSTSTACRLRGRLPTTRWSRTTSGPNASTRSAGSMASIRPSRRGVPIGTRPFLTRRAWRRSSSSFAAWACIRRRFRSGCCGRARRTDASCATRATRFRARSTRRATPTSAASGRCCSSPTVTLWTNALARRLMTDACRPHGGSGRGRAQRRAFSGSRRRSSSSSCGAVNSAALLLRSATDKHPNGLANSSGLVGRRYMAHLATMMQGFHPFRLNDTVFQKTVGINDFYLHGPNGGYPLGQIQSQGRTHGVMAQTVAPWIPLWAYDAWVARGVDWLVMSEDLPRDENRVTVDRDGRIRLALPAEQPRRAPAAGQGNEAHPPPARVLGGRGAFASRPEHDAPVRHPRLRQRPAVVGARSRIAARTMSRTCSSWMPRSSPPRRPSIPGLTIAAQALRVADHIRDTHLAIDDL